MQLNIYLTFIMTAADASEEIYQVLSHSYTTNITLQKKFDNTQLHMIKGIIYNNKKNR